MMKNCVLSFACLAAFLSCKAAHVFSLVNGENWIGAVGEIVAVEANTVDASQAVTCTVVTTVNEYTNAWRTATTPHVRYDFTVTNYDGNASVVTNTLDAFSYDDWATNVSWIGSVVTNVPAAGVTNVTTNVVSRHSRIVSPVVAVTTNISQQVEDGKRIKATYSHRSEIGNGTAQAHYLKITPASAFLFTGGRIDVSCGQDDNLRILVK